MYVLVSHKPEDSTLAKTAAKRPWLNDADLYLDKYDPNIDYSGDDILLHLREAIGLCNHLIIVISDRTQSSWRAPWEIGIAMEKNYSIATFANVHTALPEYLDRWPIGDKKLARNKRMISLSKLIMKIPLVTVMRKNKTQRIQGYYARRVDQ
jgi:hypothetical protein